MPSSLTVLKAINLFNSNLTMSNNWMSVKIGLVPVHEEEVSVGVGWIMGGPMCW